MHDQQAVLRHVMELGLRTRTGRKISAQQFGTILRNRLYAGWMQVQPWTDVKAKRASFEPIVSDEIFDRVQALLDGRRPSVTPHLRNHPDFPLRVFARCGECGTPLTGSWSTGKRKPYAYYHCRQTACRAIYAPKTEVENGFTNYLTALVPKPEYFRLFRDIVLDVWKAQQADAVEVRQRLQRTRDELIARKDRLVEAFIHRGVIDEPTYERQAGRVDEELVHTETALHDAELEEIDVDGVLNFAGELLGNAAHLWLEASLDQKQRLQKVLFPKGITYSRCGAFGTPEVSLVFRLLQAVPTHQSSEARPG
jgi:site-specific DNA recombinase